MTERPRRGLPRWLWAYLLLLAASHVVRAVREPTRVLADGVQLVTLTEVADDARIEGEVEVALRDTGGDGASGAWPVLLLHGSPGRLDDFGELQPLLANDRRVLAIDLPGFGASTRELADYSVRAHAHYVEELLETLDLERVHVVGFSMGGGVGLELTDLAPERVASLTMLSAIGVQELELLGDHHLNRGIHGLQLGALWALEELVPHFGLLDGGLLSVAYARNFYDTDQRPLRARLEALEAPLLVIHGEHDVLVPYAVAEEHHRLVPHSELVTFDANHFLVFRRPDALAEVLAPFFERVEAGAQPTRADADPARLARASTPFDPADVEPLSGFALAILLVLAALGTLVSEDLACIGVGALVGQGRLAFLPGTLACLVGIYVGDILLFLAGRVLGRRALGRWPLRTMLSEERVERSSRWFEERGPYVIFASRFLPGSRLPTYFAAGLLKTSFWRFTLWFALAAILWTPVLVWLAGTLAGTLAERLEFLQENFALAFVGTVAVVFLIVKVGVPLATHRGRRLLFGSWLRKVRWEYWPRSVFYPPIALACVWFGLRHRRPFAFTAANPGILHAGVVGESKAAILRGLTGADGMAGERLARTLVVPAGDAGELGDELAHRRLDAVRAFQAELDAPWPLVAKPDVGQRGDGVHVVRDEADLADAFAALSGRVLVQEFVDGPEFGVFWLREPGAARGRIFSIARKVLPSVTGDGRHTLEHLILHDRRTVPFATAFLARHADRLHEVPAAGARVPLGELGTHCRGATFLDGRALLTPELEAAVEETARAFEGFSFGRFDVRAPSDEAFRAGEFRVLELNGVTSEAAHVYDPDASVLAAWRTLIEQWRLAYAIGAAHGAAGAPVSGPLALWRAVRAYGRDDGADDDERRTIERIPRA